MLQGRLLIISSPQSITALQLGRPIKRRLCCLFYSFKPAALIAVENQTFRNHLIFSRNKFKTKDTLCFANKFALDSNLFLPMKRAKMIQVCIPVANKK